MRLVWRAGGTVSAAVHSDAAERRLAKHLLDLGEYDPHEALPYGVGVWGDPA
jgi:hypothetical protein